MPRRRPPAPRQVPPAPFAPVGPGVLACGLVCRLEAGPGPAAAHRNRSQALPLPINVARNSPAACSDIEFKSLELQRFLTLLKLHQIELHAKFVWGWVMPSPTGAAARPLCRPAISHVIPLWLVQTLNLYRWNCNVFERSRKMTVGNYVRLMLRWLSPSLLGPSNGRGRCGHAPPRRSNFACNSSECISSIEV